MTQLMTNVATDREKWLRLRREGVTATDIVTIAGLNPYDSPFALYHRKLQILPDLPETPQMRLGRWLEDRIVKHWELKHDHHGTTEPGGLWAREGWALASPDRLVGDRLLETKATSLVAEWDDGVPARVRTQVLWQLWVTGRRLAHVAVCFLPSGEVADYMISLDDHEKDLFYLIDKGTGFYEQMAAEIPPEIDSLPATAAAVKALHPEMVKGRSAEVPQDLAAMYLSTVDALRVLDNDRDYWATKLRDVMGDAQFATYEGHSIARRDIYDRRAYSVEAGKVDRLVPLDAPEVSREVTFE